jgi:hypothetical protein
MAGRMRTVAAEKSKMTGTKALLALAWILGESAGLANAIELKSATLDAWHGYLNAAGVRMQARLDHQQQFLWVDNTPGLAARVRGGEIVVAPLVGHGTQEVPDGLIHDWIGAAFIPNATIETLQEVVHDYDRYQEIYRPVVTDSRTIASNQDGQQFSMIWHRKVLFVNIALQGEYVARDFTLGPHRGYSIIDASQVQEIEDYGRSSEHVLPPDTGSGFIWRLHSIARYEERDGGVYLEIEALALTRNIPASLRWLVTPVVNHLSVNSLTTTLRQTRQAVRDCRPTTEQVAMGGRKRSK